MRLMIYRGAHTGGGTGIEISTKKTRVIIDFGVPAADGGGEVSDAKFLDGKTIDRLRDEEILPGISGFYRDDRAAVTALLVTHSSRDHYGSLGYVHPAIPLYMSDGVAAFVRASNLFVRHAPEEMAYLPIARRRLAIGDLAVTTFPVDRASPDGRALLIEADGRRLFYSGDCRGHGRKSVLFRTMAEHPPGPIDRLIIDGTTVDGEAARYRDEKAVQLKIEAVLKARKGITLLAVPPHHIARVVAAHKACRYTDSIFVIDLYTAFLSTRLAKIDAGIPQHDAQNVRVLFSGADADILTKAGYRDLLYVYNKRKIQTEEINKKKERILMLVRDTALLPAIVKGVDHLDGATLIDSVCAGHRTASVRDFCAKRGIAIEEVSASSYPAVDDLCSFVAALKPRTVTPIGPFAAAGHALACEHLEIVGDNTSVEV